jgi:hypothetical protein
MTSPSITKPYRRRIRRKPVPQWERFINEEAEVEERTRDLRRKNMAGYIKRALSVAVEKVEGAVMKGRRKAKVSYVELQLEEVWLRSRFAYNSNFSHR